MESMLDKIRRLEEYDTPTITNVVATLPKDSNCLGLYHPWRGNWYADQSLKCMFPGLGARAGFVVTAVYGLPDATYDRLHFEDILHALEKAPKPVVLAVQQDFPETIRNRNGLMGGNMFTAFQSMGVAGVITDGPSRDIHEIRPMGIQCMFTGLAAGHGPFAVQAINVPVSICGIDVAPGDIVHMDENGAMKFPAAYLDDVILRAQRLTQREADMQAAMRATSDPGELARILERFSNS